MADAPPCPMRAQNHPHDAHDWNAGESRCPGYSEPAEGHAEPAPPQTPEEKVHDLEYVIQRVREAVGTDAVLVSCEEHADRIETLESALRGVLAMFEKQIEQRLVMGALSINTVRRWHNVLDGEAREAENDSSDETPLAEARNWARHGYEIGQRHCGWSDHGVAPAWLTEGWPRSFDSCEHTKEAAEYDTALTRVRGLSDRPEAMDPNRPYSGDYLLGYRMAISTAKSVASNERAVVKHVEEDAICGVCGGGPVVYRNYKEQAFCQTCANCGCDQDPCVRTGINAPLESAPPIKPETAPDCTASLTVVYQDAPIRCTQPAGHYDFEVKPDPYAEPRNPGGWHRGEGNVWADIAEGATPHGESP